MTGHTRAGHTRLFWIDAAIGGPVSLGWLEAACVELTEHVDMTNGIAGFDRDVRTRTIRGVGTYVESDDYTTGTVMFFDQDDGGGGPVWAEFEPDTVAYGSLVFVWDADGQGGGGAGGRVTVFDVATVGAQDQIGADNVAAGFVVEYVIRSRPWRSKDLLP